MNLVGYDKLKATFEHFVDKINELKVSKQHAIFTLKNATITDSGSALTASGTGVDFDLAKAIIQTFTYEDAKAIFGL